MRRAGDRAQRARCDFLAANRSRPRPVRAALRRPRAAGQQRPVHVPRPGAPASSSSTGSRPRTTPSPILRAEAGRDPYDQALTDLVGELSTRSEEFRTRWAAHNVRYHRTGVKRLHHPVVGDLELDYEVMELAADTGLTMLVYTAEPGSRTEEALHLLASWAATPEQQPATEEAPRS